MKTPKCIVIDFETKGIEQRPKYPPVPVGVSILWPGKKSKYYAWGHLSENNCSFEQAQNALREAWDSGLPLLFHNAKFDYDVATTHMKMKPLPWERIHDTMYLLFLLEPHAMTFALKPSAERVLGMPPEEQDAVKDWILTHVEEVKRKKSEWGKYIWMAPGSLVGKYADGDVVRTDLIFKKLFPQIVERQMVEPYDKERELMPILLENERQGIRADLDLMQSDRKVYGQALEDADNWLRKTLGVPELNVDSDTEIARILDELGIVTEWEMTPTGKKSTAKKNLTPDKFTGDVRRNKRRIATGAQVASVLGYRNRLLTCLSVFMDNWLTMAEASNGIIYTNWNQVRQSSSGGDMSGARTGRMSSNPNFMNIPKSFYDKGDGYVHPAHVACLPELPLMRKYILPDKYGKIAGVFGHRDYNQQEIRILAHFENGELMQRYIETPRLDIHTLVQGLIHEITGHLYARSPVKIVNFGKIYGMGVAKLALATGSTVEDARRLSDAHKRALPGVGNLERTLKALAKANEPIITWGGREYFCEPPRMINGRMQSFEYKLLNYLIQGSAADCTKTAIIEFNKIRKDSRFLVTVHDEINISCPPKAVKQEMRLLKEAMESVKFDVPMLSDGKTGPRWGDLTKYED